MNELFESSYLSIMTQENDRLRKEIERLNNIINELEERINKAIKYINQNCILSDEWKEIGFCNFVPVGSIEFKQLSETKIKILLSILRGDKE